LGGHGRVQQFFIGLDDGEGKGQRREAMGEFNSSPPNLISSVYSQG